MADNQSKKLFLLDAYALIFRSYYAFIKNPRITSKGLNTSAIFGFLLTLEEVLQKQKPTHIAVVFDTPQPTFRHLMFKEYKANRDETPEDIKKAVPYIKKLIEAYKIPVIACPGFEADDVIGTLARKASDKGFVTYMMTPDKDFAQLVSENVFMFKPSRSGNESVLWGVEDIKREFCVERPEQVIDVLGLMGDASDNIPGAPGIGPKTAMKLISEYGSIEAVLKNTDKLKGKVKEIIENNKEQIEFSKKLVTIEQYVPVELNEQDLLTEIPDKEKLKILFDELEFKAVATRIFSEIDKKEPQQDPKIVRQPEGGSFQGSLFGDEIQTTPKEKQSISETPHSYILIDNEKDLSGLVSEMSSLREFCFDTETTSLNSLEAELVGISFSWKKGEGYMVYFPESKQETQEILKKLKPVFENPESVKIGQNLKFDIQVLANYGILVNGKLFDTMLAHYLLEPDLRHNMDFMSETYLSYTPVPIESLIGEKGRNQKNMRSVPVEKVLEYAVEDADVTYQLMEVFNPRLLKEGLFDLAEKIEMPLVRVLADMERAGVLVDYRTTTGRYFNS
jgi:DNA polymerase-1